MHERVHRGFNVKFLKRNSKSGFNQLRFVISGGGGGRAVVSTVMKHQVL